MQKLRISYLAPPSLSLPLFTSELMTLEFEFQLAGVLSSFLRSGPNGTSPIKFNLTEAVERLTKFQLLPSLPIRLPLLPAFGARPKEGNATDERRIAKSGKKRLVYRNPSRNPNYAVNLHNEVELNPNGPPVQPIPPIKDEDYDDGPTRTTRKPPTGDSRPYVPPIAFPMYPVATTTEDSLDQEEKAPVGHAPSAVATPSPAPETLDEMNYPPYPTPTYATETPGFDVRNVDALGVAGWIGLYLNPALKLAKDATKNVTLSGVVNGKAEGVKTGVASVASGVQQIATGLPKFVEVISGLVDFFENIN